ncbi:sensor histidine kinase [Deinococcus enclensis]|uniref:histidine kinase n=1 Tax=Deinococcus enclensis TaxID=1049582 RepID=A0ABT9MGM3_9DEIO|nr:ATP-binding protein [Deinococcus enclensis]MDP9765723.1 signal transduction histidine kinase [Deinococcus enclensis]
MDHHDTTPEPAPDTTPESAALPEQAPPLFLDAPVAALLLTLDGRITAMNSLAHGLLGLPAEPPQRRAFTALLAARSRAAFRSALDRAVLDTGRQSLEARMPVRAGPDLEVRLDLAAVRPHGEPVQVQVVVTDLTPFKQAHQTLLDSQEAYAGQLQSSGERSRALNEELEQVVGAVLQELYLPASRVMTATGQLRQALGPAADDVQAQLLPIEQASQQQLAIIQSVERYMKARRLRPRLRPIALGGLIEEIRATLKPLLADRDVQVTQDALPVVLGDRQALTLILEEYLSNALKFTRSRNPARLHVLLRETDTEYLIGVEDNGVGFSMRHRARLFRLFQRLHAASDYEGSALGLATVQRVAAAYGARVWGEGRVDQGATFWLAWPREPRIRK